MNLDHQIKTFLISAEQNVFLTCTGAFFSLMFHQIMCKNFHEDNFVIADSVVTPMEHFTQMTLQIMAVQRKTITYSSASFKCWRPTPVRKFYLIHILITVYQHKHRQFDCPHKCWSPHRNVWFSVSFRSILTNCS